MCPESGRKYPLQERWINTYGDPEYVLYYDDAIDPHLTDWTTTPPTVTILKQDDYGPWERGAYLFTAINCTTLVTGGADNKDALDACLAAAAATLSSRPRCIPNLFILEEKVQQHQRRYSTARS